MFSFPFYFVTVHFVNILTLALNMLLCPGLIWQTPKVLIANEAMTTHTSNFNFLPHSVLVLFILKKILKKNKIKKLKTHTKKFCKDLW